MCPACRKSISRYMNRILRSCLAGSLSLNLRCAAPALQPSSASVRGASSGLSDVEGQLQAQGKNEDGQNIEPQPGKSALQVSQDFGCCGSDAPRAHPEVLAVNHGRMMPAVRAAERGEGRE